MRKIKRFFETPKKTAVTIACLVVLLLALSMGTVFAAGAIAKSSSIGEENARNFAFADAGIDPVSAERIRTEFDYEQGQFVYEIEFVADGTEYEYWIKASDGSVVKKQLELVDRSGEHTTVTGKISLDAAKAAALKDAALSEEEVTYTKSELDVDDGISVYEIDFYTEDTAYEYEIDANTGAVYSKSREHFIKSSPEPSPAPGNSAGETEKDPQKEQNLQQSGGNGAGDLTGDSKKTETNSGSQEIGLEAAKHTALADAGVATSAVTYTKAKWDRDDGVAVYEIEFYTASHTYDYEINAVTGAIRSKDIEALDADSAEYKDSDSSNAGSSGVTLERAKSIAVDHAGFAASDVIFSKAKRKREDGLVVYEIEFYVNGMEYEYTINAATGNIVEYDADWEDD